MWSESHGIDQGENRCCVCEIVATAPPGLSASPQHLQVLGERLGDLGC